MKRPSLTHFIAIKTSTHVAIKALIHLKSKEKNNLLNETIENFNPSSPLKSLGLFSSDKYKIRIFGRNKDQQIVFEKLYESDNYGEFTIKIQLQGKKKEISIINVFEESFAEGVSFNLGSFIPIEITEPKKIIISDFDKTLVDTRYSTTKDLYYSLSQPVSYFPNIDKSIKLLKDYVANGFQPFILTASPHFYENAIRDWLYQNQIFSAGIFLKDYRKVFSFIDTALTPKDLKTQGFYKLNHLVNILLMTEIPEELVLMGDGFESDKIIYLTLSELLSNKKDPWYLWKNLKSDQSFRLSTDQDSIFLNKFYQLHNLVNKEKEQKIKINIHIRVTKEEHKNFPNEKLFNESKDFIHFYHA